MSRSIHQTVRKVAGANTKATLTPDHPDVVALAQKTRYKLTQRERRAADVVSSQTGVKGRSRKPTVK